MEKTKIDQLMAKQMSRKQFLITLGSIIIGVLGVSFIIGLFTPNDSPQDHVVMYGMGYYGP
jgi:hypothetical protein